MKYYILFDHDTEKLVNKTAYVDYEDAVAVAESFDNVIVIAFCV